MGKLIQEAALDDRFNAQMAKVQDAISRLHDIIGDMGKPGSMTKPIASQKRALRHAAEDLKALHDKV